MGIHFCSLLAAATLLFAVSGSASAELVVIVSARSPATSLSSDQVAAIFLGQAGRLPDGADVVALDQRIGSSERDQFYRQVAGKTPALLKAHWSKMVFTGRGQPPREALDGSTVRRMVAENPSMIGYVDRSALDGSVRPVLVLR
ncbi:phosphate ABC transporter substrate-binding protein [Telluria aromaticivorans]|uniref:Phosphate ABC transporter substrate-binding protein n=1 Tax=Telluria aromaticivorans TaxID=2725995 RepID=A0A7Y2NZ66_9BURK|nr:phosphate ABC transporter substrate-binding protein [Telluria aromaticivorans]NNG23577.1 phosphate ABC transporter substrate-binding protein [Telluria aromaticivorans]